MEIALFYPAADERAAVETHARLARVSTLRPTLIATEPESFLEDLAGVCDSSEPLLAFLSRQLIPAGRPPRASYAPLLKRLEAGSPTAVVALDAVQLPPLLGPHTLATQREIEAWAIARLPRQIELMPTDAAVATDPALIEKLFVALVDNAASLELRDSLEAHRFAALAAPHFEAVQVLDARHQSPALLDAVLSRIQPPGRKLWILNGYTGPKIEAEPHASILTLPDAEPAAALDPYALLRATPVIEGEPLPFSTHEFERTLPHLFESNWPLAERIARKAGAFFRVNNRVAEAIWIYDLLQRASQTPECAAHCESELYWLRAGGERKAALLDASQASFNFNG